MTPACSPASPCKAGGESRRPVGRSNEAPRRAALPPCKSAGEGKLGGDGVRGSDCGEFRLPSFDRGRFGPGTETGEYRLPPCWLDSGEYIVPAGGLMASMTITPKAVTETAPIARTVACSAVSDGMIELSACRAGGSNAGRVRAASAGSRGHMANKDPGASSRAVVAGSMRLVQGVSPLRDLHCTMTTQRRPRVPLSQSPTPPRG